MNSIDLREKRSHGTPEFRFSIEEVFSVDETTEFSPLHFHDEFEFCIVEEGLMSVQINENCLTLRAGEGIFINSATLHSILPESNSKGHMTIMMFDPGFIAGDSDIIRNKYLEPLIKGKLVIPKKLTQEEYTIILKSKELYEKKFFGYEIELKGYALRLLSILLGKPRSAEEKVPSKNIELVKKTIGYIHKNYQSEITLSQMADNVFVSPEHLCRVFSQFSDVSPFQYLNRYRVLESTKMLTEKNYPISEIASLVGFNSSSYYNKMFMRHMGCTPSQYRKSK